MARQAYAMPDLVAAAATELRSLRDLTGETTYLAALDGLEVISLERCDGAHTQRSSSDLGQRKPLHCTSQGKAISARVHDLVTAAGSQLTLMFESFAFKRGIPVHADFVFDVRMLPNPHYAPALKHLTGRDQPVIDFLQEQADVKRMLQQISTFIKGWLPDLARDNRSYVTVAIGCTGGQHRSVYLVEQLAKRFTGQWVTLTRHREMDARNL